MTLEQQLEALLKPIATQVFAVVAPAGTKPPFAVYQQIGGRVHYFLDNTPTDVRNALVQVAVWASTRLGAIQTMRRVEATLRSAPNLACRPTGKIVVPSPEVDTDRFGAVQRFSIDLGT